MCGINGLVFNSSTENLSNRIEKMNFSLKHRGDDSSGIFLREYCSFGHQRLSIIDLNSTGHQPMCSNNENWVVVFNGEIYNFKSIKEKIKNYDFKGNSDTEVIVASLEIKGLEWFLHHANGMFAIGAHNLKTKKTYLIRDRLGIKPLFYYLDDSKLIFSSEIKGILNSGLINPEFNDRAIDDYLSYRYVREPYTFFRNIFQVKSSSYIEIDRRLIKSENFYWEIPNEFNLSKKYDEEKIINKLESKLIDAIELRMISDVPLGTYLSGGIDSSLLTAIVQKNSTEKINTYNIGFNELNEFEYARIIANQYNTNHHELISGKEKYFEDWVKLIKFKDAPLAVPNEIILSKMSNVLKEKITVVLSGEGADELLGGYGRIFRSNFEYNKKERNETFHDYFINNYEYVSRDLRDEFLINNEGYRNLFDDKNRNMFNASFSNDYSIFHFFHKYHVKGLLQRVDMSTMQATVEARVPFLDHKLIDFVYTEIPFEMKLRWKSDNDKIKALELSPLNYSENHDIPKYALRKLAYKYLDKRVVDRKKVGFPVPLDNWITDLDNMSNEFLSKASWLNTKKLDNLLLKLKQENRTGQITWMLINVELFKQEYFNKKWTW